MNPVPNPLSSTNPVRAIQPSPATQETVPASTLHEIYLALLRPDADYVKRFKTVQAAAAQYEPDTPNSGAALDGELSRLINRPVRLSDVQLRCFKEILINEPAFAHI